MKRTHPIKPRLLATAIAVIGSLATAQAGSFSADFNDGLVPLDSAVYGSANVQSSGGYTNSGYLQLTAAAASLTGVYIVTSDLDAGAPVAGLTVDLKMSVGGGTGAGDGFSFNFANDLDLSGAWGTPEEGNGTGLSIDFDTYPNGVSDAAPSIDVKVGGVAVAQSFAPQLVTGTGNYVDVRIQLNPDRTLTVVYDGVYAYTNLDLSAYLVSPGYPFTGAYVGIGARTGGSAYANMLLDDLSIVTRTNDAAFVRSYSPTGRWTQPTSAIDITLTNSTTSVNNGSIVLQVDDATVSPIIATANGKTTIHFAPAGGFGTYTAHSVKLAFADNASPTPNTSTLQYRFSVPADSYVTLFSDGFENYTAGGVPLDMNTAGANASPNGGPGNPWSGPNPPNLRVFTSEGGVVPHSGSKMTRGSLPTDLDQDWYNLAFRLNKGNLYTGNIMMDWWFYDPIGSGGAAYAEFGAIGYYSLTPTTTDYPDTGSLNSSGQIQRLSLGASSSQGTGFDSTRYQARVVGAGDGYASGWFNLPVTRSVGWHHGRVVVGPTIDIGVNYAQFFIDDMSTPIFQHVDRLAYGYNVLELNQAYKATFGYMDDVSFAVARPPVITATLSGTDVILTWPGLDFALESASDVNGPYSEVSGAVSGYGYSSFSGSQQFFRLRNK